MKTTTCLALLAAVATLTTANLQAGLITHKSYESGVAATTGAAGAADPAGQGWGFNGSSNSFASGYDSGDGGWRTVDGTNTAPAFYDSPLSAQDVLDLTSSKRAWTLSATFSMDNDAIGSPSGFAGSYYDGRNDDNISLWVENSDFNYILEFEVDPASGTGPWNLTLNQLDGGPSGIPLTTDDTGFETFHELTLTSTDGGATADLLFDGNFITTLNSTSGLTTNDWVVFGAYSGGGQGSAVWNSVELASVPEPGTYALSALLLLGGFVFVRRRRARA